MKKLLFAALLLVGALTGSAFAQTAVEADKLVGTWRASFEELLPEVPDMKYTLILNADSSYAGRIFIPSEEIDGAIVVTNIGTWTAAGDSITLTNDYDKSKLEYVGDNAEVGSMFEMIQDQVKAEIKKQIEEGNMPEAQVLRNVSVSDDEMHATFEAAFLSTGIDGLDEEAQGEAETFDLTFKRYVRH